MLASEGITAGRGGGNYCPDAFVLRGPIATLLAKSFYVTPAGPDPVLGAIRLRD